MATPEERLLRRLREQRRRSTEPSQPTDLSRTRSLRDVDANDINERLPARRPRPEPGAPAGTGSITARADEERAIRDAASLPRRSPDNGAALDNALDAAGPLRRTPAPADGAESLRTGFSQPTPEPGLVTGAGARPGQPRAPSPETPEASVEEAEILQPVTTGRHETLRGLSRSAMDLDSAEVRARRAAGEQNPVGSAELRAREQGSGSLPRASQSLESLRQNDPLFRFASGRGKFGEPVFDNDSIKRLSEADPESLRGGFSISSPAPGNEITADQRISDREALGLITPEQAEGERARLSDQERTAAENLRTITEARAAAARGQKDNEAGSQQIDAQEQAPNVAAIASEDLGAEITAPTAQVLIESFNKAREQGTVPSGVDNSDLAALTAIAQGLPEIGQGLTNSVNTLITGKPRQAFSLDPIFGLVNELATGQGRDGRFFKVGGKEIDIGELSDRLNGRLQTIASRVRNNLAAEGVNRIRSGVKVSELPDKERSVLQNELDEFKRGQAAAINAETDEELSSLRIPSSGGRMTGVGPRSAQRGQIRERRRIVQQQRDQRLKDIEELDLESFLETLAEDDNDQT